MAAHNDEWLIGVALCLVGAAGTCLGMNLQKFSHMRNEEKPAEEQRMYLYQKTWIAGFLVFTVGQTLNLGSLGFAPQALLAVLGSFGLVCNVIFAPLLLKERTTHVHVLATLVIIGGSVLVVLSSPKSPQVYTLTELENNFKQDDFIVYAAITGPALAVAIGWWACHSKHANTGVVCAFIAALLGSYSLLFGKCTMQLLKETAKGNNQMVFVVTYLIMGSFAFCAVANVHFINMSLAGGDALLIVPLYYVANMLFTIAGGLIYFEEWNFSTAHGIMFAVGVVLTVVGVFVLGRADAKRVEVEEVDSSGDSDGKGPGLSMQIEHSGEGGNDGEGGEGGGASGHRRGSGGPSGTQIAADGTVVRGTRATSDLSQGSDTPGAVYGYQPPRARRGSDSSDASDVLLPPGVNVPQYQRLVHKPPKRYSLRPAGRFPGAFPSQRRRTSTRTGRRRSSVAVLGMGMV